VLWDAPEAKRVVTDVPWAEIMPTDIRGLHQGPREIPLQFRRGKRAFDIVFSLVALAVTLPLYPLIMLAIVLEDGFPIFFSHRRETLGGRTFPCLKFRSMRRDAEAMKAKLAAQNKADGPQFFMEQDPRLTRVGRFLRRTNLDELPQFINVLLGHMSVVGPRPSPYSENQYCPGWRNARLSTRPGITGLWQVMRSRNPGLDFQEWIKYDIAYVESMSFKLDLWIIWKTFGVLLGGLVRR
jgi:lipopolysaccharide/colanic/teichoic acid biosynthesis glycosyltransferase